MIFTILLLPHAGTRERLLAQYAPSAYRLPEKPEAGWVFGTVVAGGLHYADDDGWETDPTNGWSEHALVLARSGAVVPEGSDRLFRVADVSVPFDDALLAVINGGAWDVSNLVAVLAPLGTLLLLDADGREVVS